MAIRFQKLSSGSYPPNQARNTAYLEPGSWDDFGHKTLFTLTVFDEQGLKHSLGSVKISFAGQKGGGLKKRSLTSLMHYQAIFILWGRMLIITKIL